jgi:AhpD family alkylhydroperoxidase
VSVAQAPTDGSPRIAPGARAEIGAINALITSLVGRVAGTPEPPHLFTTLARHRRLFRRWLRFAGALMPGGTLPRRDTELVILRVAANCDCEYERRHHEHIGRRAGLSDADIARVDQGPATPGWNGRETALLQAVDELHRDRTLSDALWPRLREQFSDAELIELCLLVGHYEMLAMTLNGLRVQPDELGDRPPSLLARIGDRRR